MSKLSEQVKRLYIIEYDIDNLIIEKEMNHVKLYYTYKNRQDFIEKYLKLKNNNIWYIENLKVYYADFVPIEVKDMELLINAI